MYEKVSLTRKKHAVLKYEKEFKAEKIMPALSGLTSLVFWPHLIGYVSLLAFYFGLFFVRRRSVIGARYFVPKFHHVRK